MVKKVQLRIKAQFFDPGDLIYIIRFLNTFMVACDNNRIRERAAILVLPHYVNETHPNTLNSHMCAMDMSSPIAASVSNVDDRSRQFLRSDPEVGNYLLKKFTSCEANKEF